jgi:alanine racemase
VTLRLEVDAAAWRAHVATWASTVDGLVPVVKGNGYGFGRAWLAAEAAGLADTIAVGTVHELADLPAVDRVVVLTPSLEPPPSTTASGATVVPTVGAEAHLDALSGWGGPVLVKLASSMRRYGRGPELVDAARAAGLDVIGVSVHPPLVGDDEAHLAEILEVTADVDPSLDGWVSHLGPAARRRLPADRRWRLRAGTALWHGDKSMLRLTAEVLDVRPVDAGERAGYRGVTVPHAGTLVCVSAGTAHGVHPLPDGRSPFHHRRTRLALLEPPHMHTSMLLVGTSGPVPAIGERVDVQRPLTTTLVDRVDWY